MTSSLILRCFNVYGLKQNFNSQYAAVIPKVIESAKKNMFLKLNHGGNQSRDFVHIDDIVHVYKLLSEKLYMSPAKYSGEIFNAGTNSPKKIKDVVKQIYLFKKKFKEYKSIVKNIKKNRTQGEISVQFMDYKKLYKYFKWKPKKNFEKSLPSLFKWYENYLKNN